MGSPSATGGSGTGPQELGLTTRKNILEKIVDASPTVRVVKAVVKNIKETKQKKDMQKSLDYEAAAYGTKPKSFYETQTGGDDRGGDQGNVGAATSGGVVVQAPQPVTSPTTAEVSQSTAAQAEDPILLRKRRTLARGRSPTIMTGVTGATGGLTLGKPSLLGR